MCRDFFIDVSLCSFRYCLFFRHAVLDKRGNLRFAVFGIDILFRFGFIGGFVLAVVEQLFRILSLGNKRILGFQNIIDKRMVCRCTMVRKLVHDNRTGRLNILRIRRYIDFLRSRVVVPVHFGRGTHIIGFHVDEFHALKSVLLHYLGEVFDSFSLPCGVPVANGTDDVLQTADLRLLFLIGNGGILAYVLLRFNDLVHSILVASVFGNNIVRCGINVLVYAENTMFFQDGVSERITLFLGSFLLFGRFRRFCSIFRCFCRSGFRFICCGVCFRYSCLCFLCGYVSVCFFGSTRFLHLFLIVAELSHCFGICCGIGCIFRSGFCIFYACSLLILRLSFGLLV